MLFEFSIRNKLEDRFVRKKKTRKGFQCGQALHALWLDGDLGQICFRAWVGCNKSASGRANPKIMELSAFRVCHCREGSATQSIPFSSLLRIV